MTGQNGTGDSRVVPASSTGSQPKAVKQAGFLQKKKLSLGSPVQKIGDRLREISEPNRNRRNRNDFEHLKQTSSQFQE